MKSDFIIIGAGIAGASAAYELAGEGKVILLERESWLAYHSTGRSAAVFMETYGNKTVRGLTRGSSDFYLNPPEGFSEVPLFHSRGALFLATEEQNDLIHQQFEEMKNDIDSLEFIKSEEIKKLVPIMNNDLFKAGIYESSAKDLDAHEIHQGYIRGLNEKGGKLVMNCEVHSINQKNGVWYVSTTAGEFNAPIIINAAGAWADEIASLAGVRKIGLEAKKRTVMYIDMDEYNISKWPYVGDISETFYFKPDAGKLFFSPCDEIPITPCDAKPNDLDVAIAINTVEIATDLEVKSVDHSMAGLRSFVADRAPVVGQDAENPNFFWLVGQGGYGFQTAPALARCCHALVTGGQFPMDLEKLGVDPQSLSPNRISLERS